MLKQIRKSTSSVLKTTTRTVTGATGIVNTALDEIQATMELGQTIGTLHRAELKAKAIRKAQKRLAKFGATPEMLQATKDNVLDLVMPAPVGTPVRAPKTKA